MMRVCFFSGDIRRSGGTERVATVIASALAHRGYEVTILSLANGETSFFPVAPGIRLCSLGMEGRSANLSDGRIWLSLHRFIKEESIGYLINIDIILSWYSIPASIGTQTKVISWEHFHFFINVGDFFQRWRRSAARWLAVNFSSAVVTLTEKDRDQYLRSLRCKAPVVAIHNPKTIAHTKKAALDSRVVLAAGRLTPQKGFDLLLQSWATVVTKATDWKLRIVGSGEDEALLKALTGDLGLTDTVEFIPRTDDMERHFLEASVYALSSRFEGFGLVLVEAKSFGLPVVSFDCDCGPSDIVRDGRDGVLVRSDDVESFAQGLLVLMNDEAKRKEFGDVAWKDERFELEKIVDEWELQLK